MAKKKSSLLKTIRSFFVGPSLIATLFHKQYYKIMVAVDQDFNTRWNGVPMQKYPCDLMVYQEILFENKPDFIIECGTKYGGSALFLASICDLIGKGSVITIDINEVQSRREHPRIVYLHGSSTSDEIIKEVRRRIFSNASVMVILDSNHQYHHVLDELRTYHELVTSGQYLIVEDTNINGNPVFTNYGPGPMEAVRHFLPDHPDFTVDRSREKYLVTFNPHGYLRKK